MLTLLLVLVVVVELLVYAVSWLWARRRYAVGAPLFLTAFGTGAVVWNGWRVWSVLLVATSAFRIINMLRVAEGRMHAVYLKRATTRSALWLGGLQVLVLFALDHVPLSGSDLAPALATAQLVVAMAILATTVRNIVKSRHIPVAENFADRDLPTVTVAIPARNETADLEDCLRSILANTYPKFEVLVLDDCSHDRTPELIKEFAQDGVRFVKGDEPQQRWLAKNQAYDKLADQANGDILLFAGSDVRFGPETIRALITTMLSRKKDMVSVMPRRLTSDAAAAFIQPMRYWWELALPRRFFNRPPVLSTCWLIRRKTLRKLGGFQAVQHAIVPEGYFAREVIKTDGYSFVRADDVLDVQTRKRLDEQRETAVRMRYPQIRRRLEWALLLTMAELLFLAGPFVGLAAGLWMGSAWMAAAGGLACALLGLVHVMIVQVSNPANVLVAALTLPIVIVTELVLGLESLYKYEFSTVDWKGRNVCIPVMHVIPRLPKVD
jgi:chlorobactene glucosyltransferase